MNKNNTNTTGNPTNALEMELLSARRYGEATLLRDATGKILILSDRVDVPNRVAKNVAEAIKIIDNA